MEKICNIKRLRVSLLFFCVFSALTSSGQIAHKYTSSNIVTSKPYQSGNIYQKDFLLFLDMLKACHPAFASDQVPPFNIDSLNNIGYEWSEKCTSTSQLYRYMQSILTLLYDGHTTLLPIMNENLIYPFILFKDDKNIYLRGIDKKYEASLGKMITKINDQPAWEVINSFREVISCDNDTYFNDKVNDFMQLYSMWKDHKYCLSDSTLKLQFSDMETISLHPIPKKEIRLVALPNVQPSSTIREKNTKQPFIYKILPEENICYLQFNSCVDQSSLRIQYDRIKGNSKVPESVIEKKLSEIPRFDDFLTDMFGEIREGNIQTLVIDVRNNLGGNSRLCDILLSWLKPYNDIEQFKSFIRFSKLWEQSYSSLADEYKQAFLRNNEIVEMGKLYESSLLPNLAKKGNSVLAKEENSVLEKKNEYFRLNEGLTFAGNVVFIQNAKTYSSAGLLISTAVDNGIGTVVGTESSYSPCNYGDLLYWELPNTQIKGCMSHKIFVRPDGARCSERSLFPAVHLVPTWLDVLSNKDVCWEWILSKY